MKMDELMKWLSRFGELVTMSVRVSRECGDLCVELSLRYLMILLGLDLINFCNYLGHSSDTSCVEDILKTCGPQASQDVLETIRIGRELSSGEYVELDIIKSIASRLPETYLCLSRKVASHSVEDVRGPGF